MPRIRTTIISNQNDATDYQPGESHPRSCFGHPNDRSRTSPLLGLWHLPSLEVTDVSLTSKDSRSTLGFFRLFLFFPVFFPFISHLSSPPTTRRAFPLHSGSAGVLCRKDSSSRIHPIYQPGALSYHQLGPGTV